MRRDAALRPSLSSVDGSISAQVLSDTANGTGSFSTPSQKAWPVEEISTLNPALEKQPGRWAGRTVSVGFEEDVCEPATWARKKRRFALQICPYLSFHFGHCARS